MVFSKHPPIAPEDFLEEFLCLEAVFAGRVGRGAENISVRPLHLERVKVIVPLNAS